MLGLYAADVELKAAKVSLQPNKNKKNVARYVDPFLLPDVAKHNIHCVSKTTLMLHTITSTHINRFW